MSTPDPDDNSDSPLDAESDGKGLIIGVVAGLLILIGIMVVVGHRSCRIC